MSKEAQHFKKWIDEIIGVIKHEFQKMFKVWCLFIQKLYFQVFYYKITYTAFAFLLQKTYHLKFLDVLRVTALCKQTATLSTDGRL